MNKTTIRCVLAGLALLWSMAAFGAEHPGLCCLEPGNGPAVQRAVAHGEVEDTVLTFEGLDNLEPVQNFYAGGTGANGSGPGPDFGIVFSDNALAIISETAGGGGNFDLNPSGSTILFFLEGGAATMNVPAGFEDGFSFFYSACCLEGVVRVYDGEDGTGSVLAELNLPTTPPTDETPFAYDNWQPVGVEFDGVARSVDFGGTIDQIGFDNITLGDVVPGGAEPPDPGAPEPIETWPVPALSATAVVLMTLLVVLIALCFLPRLTQRV